MKQVKWMVMSLVVFLSAAPVEAQTVDAVGHRSGTQIIDFILDYEEKTIIGVAEVMPEEKYSFAPTQGEFKGVRTFAEQLKHIAADNYLLAAGILQEKPPADIGRGESGSAAVRSKAEIITYVKASYAYMHRATAAIDDVNRPIPTPEISGWPAGTATRMGVAIEDLRPHVGPLRPTRGIPANERHRSTGKPKIAGGPQHGRLLRAFSKSFTNVRNFCSWIVPVPTCHQKLRKKQADSFLNFRRRAGQCQTLCTTPSFLGIGTSISIARVCQFVS